MSVTGLTLSQRCKLCVINLIFMFPSNAEKQPDAEATCSAHDHVIFECSMTLFISFDSSNIGLHVLDVACVVLWRCRASFITNFLLIERSFFWILGYFSYGCRIYHFSVDVTPKHHMCISHITRHNFQYGKLKRIVRVLIFYV